MDEGSVAEIVYVLARTGSSEEQPKQGHGIMMKKMDAGGIMDAEFTGSDPGL